MSSKVSQRISSIPLSGIRKIVDHAKGLSDMIYFNIGEPDFTTPEHIREAAKRAIDEGFTHYTSISGIPELRRAIVEKLKNENRIDADAESEILVTAGAQPAFFAICQTFIEPGDEVVVQSPFYAGYEVTLRVVGAKMIPVLMEERKDFIIDPQNIEAKITDKTKMIILISPDNPTGSVIDKTTLKTIAEIAQDHDLIVVSDEIYEKFTYDGIRNYSIAALSGMEDRTVTINSFSKTYAMTGWRVGYIAAEKTLMKNISKVHHAMNVCASAISQKASVAALTGPQNCVNEMLTEYDRRRRETVSLTNEISGFRCQMPRGAFYVFPNIKAFQMSSLDLAIHIIKEARVVTVPGSAFGSAGEGHLRFSYATSLNEIREGLSRIKEAIEKLQAVGRQ
jgi:aspartate/methionine/tyrosine aminotransferase